jgi:hypothetical protein
MVIAVPDLIPFAELLREFPPPVVISILPSTMYIFVSAVMASPSVEISSVPVSMLM